MNSGGIFKNLNISNNMILGCFFFNLFRYSLYLVLLFLKKKEIAANQYKFSRPISVFAPYSTWILYSNFSVLWISFS